MAAFSNYAILKYNDTEVVSNVAEGVILEVLTLNKTATESTYSQGDSVTYILNLINAGSAPLIGLSVTDDLGGYAFGDSTVYPLTYEEGSIRYFRNGVAQEGEVSVDAGPLLTISGIDLPAGGYATLVYRATVNEFAPLGEGGEITNRATVSGTGITTVSAEETITADQAARLSITKSISPIPVRENSRVTYTFLIQNYGSEPVEDSGNASVSDRFDPILSSLIVTLDGRTLTAPEDYTYEPESGEFETVPGKITVPGATFTRDPETGEVITHPGSATLVVSGIL